MIHKLQYTVRTVKTKDHLKVGVDGFIDFQLFYFLTKLIPEY